MGWECVAGRGHFPLRERDDAIRTDAFRRSFPHRIRYEKVNAGSAARRHDPLECRYVPMQEEAAGIAIGRDLTPFYGSDSLGLYACQMALRSPNAHALTSR